MSSKIDCIQYVNDYTDDRGRLQCPNCKGFLPLYLPEDKSFTCKKCGLELMVFPEKDEDGEETDYGKICPISKPKKGKKQ